MFIGYGVVDGTISFTCNTRDAATKQEADTPSPPSYRIYKDITNTPVLTGNMAKVDDANTVGFYGAQVTLTGAGIVNGFYTVRIHGSDGTIIENSNRYFMIIDSPANAGDIAFAVAEELIVGFHDTANSLGKLISTAAANSGLDAAGMRAALGMALANMDTQLAGHVTQLTNIQSRIPAALVSGRMDSYVGAMTNGVIAAATFASGALDAVWSTASRTLTAFAFGVSLSSGERTTLAAVIWDSLVSGITTANSIGKRIIDFLAGDIFARLGAPAGASIAADIAAVKADTASTKGKTDQMVFTVSNQLDSNMRSVRNVGLSTKTGSNLDLYFNNNNTDTTKTVEDTGGGGGGTTDWTATERAQFRLRLGIDGAVNTPAATPQLARPGDAMALTSLYDLAKTAAQPGAQMALTSGERTTLVAAFTATLNLKRNTGGQYIPFFMRDITNPQIGVGGTPTITVAKDGASSFGSVTGGTLTEQGSGSGLWVFSPSAGDMDGGLLRFKAELQGAIDEIKDVYTHT